VAAVVCGGAVRAGCRCGSGRRRVVRTGHAGLRPSVADHLHALPAVRADDAGHSRPPSGGAGLARLRAAPPAAVAGAGRRDGRAWRTVGRLAPAQRLLPQLGRPLHRAFPTGHLPHRLPVHLAGQPHPRQRAAGHAAPRGRQHQHAAGERDRPGERDRVAGRVRGRRTWVAVARVRTRRRGAAHRHPRPSGPQQPL
ncbi:MAG: hypothetical protein AVDCRST_MAG77-4798, partial [uncultured Chloroflexi bacterium]